MVKSFRHCPLLIGISFLTLLLTGCQTTGPNTLGGGIAGGAGGGLVGAAIGAHDGKPLEGALIGAALGSTLGAAAGNQVEKQVEQENDRRAWNRQQAVSQAVTLDQVIKMTNSGLGPNVIVNQIRSLGVAQRPNANQLIWLKSQGVSDSVIEAMQSAPLAGRVSQPEIRPVFYEEHVYVRPRGYYARPCPPPYRRHPGRRRGVGFSVDF